MSRQWSYIAFSCFFFFYSEKCGIFLQNKASRFFLKTGSCTKICFFKIVWFVKIFLNNRTWYRWITKSINSKVWNIAFGWTVKEFKSRYQVTLRFLFQQFQMQFPIFAIQKLLKRSRKRSRRTMLLRIDEIMYRKTGEKKNNTKTRLLI